MAAMTPLVLTASIDNQAAIEAWMKSVRDTVQVAEDALNAVADQLVDAPHIAITLRSNSPQPNPTDVLDEDLIGRSVVHGGAPR